MKERKRALPSPVKKTDSSLLLQEFITLFASRGWLNQVLRVRRGDRKYRISCSDAGFFAYRINENHGISPGIPGWPVCFVTPDRIMDDSVMSKFGSTEPMVREWLHCFINHDLELMDS